MPTKGIISVLEIMLSPEYLPKIAWVEGAARVFTNFLAVLYFNGKAIWANGSKFCSHPLLIIRIELAWQRRREPNNPILFPRCDEKKTCLFFGNGRLCYPGFRKRNNPSCRVDKTFPLLLTFNVDGVRELGWP